MMSKTPICDRWEYESYSSGLVVPLNVAQELESELADKDGQLAEARADAKHWKGECSALQRMVYEARTEIERKDNLIERMKNCQNCGRTGGFCRHCRYAPDKRGWDDNWKEPI